MLRLTLAKDIASHPIILGIAAIIRDCKLQEHNLVVHNLKAKEKDTFFTFLGQCYSVFSARWYGSYKNIWIWMNREIKVCNGYTTRYWGFLRASRVLGIPCPQKMTYVPLTGNWDTCHPSEAYTPNAWLSVKFANTWKEKHSNRQGIK